MLVVEACSSYMHIVNAMHAKNLATLQSYDAVATNFEVAITAARDAARNRGGAEVAARLAFAQVRRPTPLGYS